MKHELRLKPDVELLVALLEPKVRNGSTIMSMQLEWDDPKKAKQILDWMNDRLVNRVKELSDERIDVSLKDLESQLASYESLTEKSHEDIIDFRSENDTFGVVEALRLSLIHI